jgi:hypothetical protein
MNEMYDMSIVTHNFGVIGILGVIIVNMVMLLKAKNIQKYKREMRIFTPLGSTAIGGVIFTGIVMMAAKHLDFTMANIVMIVFAVLLIVLEAKRVSTLKHLAEDKNALKSFKTYAFRLLLIEIIITIVIFMWMLI